MARPRTPTKILELRGSQYAGRLTREPQPEPGVPPMPDWLSPDAEAEWKRLGPRLAHLGVLSELDLGLFAGYCQALADVRQLTLEVREEGTVIPSERSGVRANPKNQLLREAYERMRSFGVLFGISPVARSRIVTEAKKEKPDKISERKRQLLSG